MNRLIDFTSPNVRSVLRTLLKDRTTGGNIIFATDVYENMSFTTEITESMLCKDEVDIRPRVSKSMEEQILNRLLGSTKPDGLRKNIGTIYEELSIHENKHFDGQMDYFFKMMEHFGNNL